MLPLPHSAERTCIPLVFYTRNVWKPSGKGKDLIGIQVCLVEEHCKGLINVSDHVQYNKFKAKFLIMSKQRLIYFLHIPRTC